MITFETTSIPVPRSLILDPRNVAHGSGTLIPESFLVYDSVMKINEYNQMMSYLTRREPRKILEEKVKKEMKLPKDVKITGSKMLNWINYNNKVHGNNTQPVTAEEKKVAEDVEAQQNKKWKYESWADGLEERTRPAKKAPVKIVKKPTVLELLEIEDWLNTIDPNYWIPEEKPKPKPEDKTRVIRTGITALI